MGLPQRVKRQNAIIALTKSISGRCQFCNRIPTLTPASPDECHPLQYAHILPARVVGPNRHCFPKANAFALCGNNGNNKECHFEFDKAIKPKLRTLANNTGLRSAWLDGEVDILLHTRLAANEDDIRQKIIQLLRGGPDTNGPWPVLTLREFFEALEF